MAAKLEVVEWNLSGLKGATEAKIGRGLDAARLVLQNIAREMAGTPAQRVRHSRKRTTSRGAKGSQYTTFIGSKPGESPQRRTGIGQKSIVSSRDGLEARVGYSRNAIYMMFHELGIRYKSGLQRRPTLVPAVGNNQAKLYATARRAMQ